MKTVIQVYTNKVCNINYDKDNIETYWGFGDVLRGIIKLYQLSEKYNFKLIVDFQHHPISKYIVNHKHQYYDMITENKDNIPLVRNTEKFLEDKKDEDIIYLLSIQYPDDKNINNKCKDYIKSILTPNEEFLLYLNEKKYKIPYKKYNIMHFRIGDEVDLVKTLKDAKFNYLLKTFEKYKETDDILISDSNRFKKYMYMYSNIFFFDTDPVHMGNLSKEDDILDTLVEFFLITGSKKIKTFNIYGWISNFVLWVSIIYDIPLVQMIQI
jgi:hypothetical protein